MSDYVADYWREAFECVVDELGAYDQFTSEQFDKAGKALAMSAECQSMAFGWDEADKSVRRMQREEHESKVLNWVDDLMRTVLSGSSRVLDYMTHEQKMALGKLQHAKQEFRRETLKAKGIS